MKSKDISLKKLPPNSPEAEMSVLGAILLDNEALNKTVGLVVPEDFYLSAHQKIYAQMLKMFDTNARIDLVTLSEALIKSGDLEMVGGPPFLMDLMEATPTATTVVHYAKIVREKSTLRKLIAISTQLNLESYEEQVEVPDLLSRAEELLFSIREGIEKNEKDCEMLGDILPGLYQDIQAISEPHYENIKHFIPTGFSLLDDMIVGMAPADNIILAGRPSMGKTAFAFAIAVNVAKTEIPVAVFSIETARRMAAMRFLCTESRVDSHLIRTGNICEDDWENLGNGISALNKIPLYICDCPGLTLQQFRAKAKMLVKEKKIKLIALDYLQLMHINSFRGKRHEEITDITRGIKSVARELNVPVLLLSQLSRKVEERRPPRPIMSDLKESGSIEENADIVIFLYRHAYYEKKVDDYGGEDLTTEIIVSKNRNGRIGTVKMIFVKRFTRFEETNIDRESY